MNRRQKTLTGNFHENRNQYYCGSIVFNFAGGCSLQTDTAQQEQRMSIDVKDTDIRMLSG